MKKLSMNRTVLAVALTAAMGVGSTSAMAALFNPFNITETSVPGATPNVITNAGKIIGSYQERAAFTSSGPIGCTGTDCGTFTNSLYFSAGQFNGTDGAPLSGSQAGQLGGGAFGTNQYQLYALFMGMGTYVTTAGKTVFTFSPGGDLKVYIDPDSNTTAVASTSTTPFIRSNFADDYLIATGVPMSGVGTLDPTLSTCSSSGPGSNINCGSFGTQTSFVLTTGDAFPLLPGLQSGSGYFTAPNPFYSLSFQSGQFDNFTPSGIQDIVGSADITFGNAVPEPESIALLGIGLLGLSIARRRRKQA